MEGFPSFGSWVTYALGTENQELPAFVAINDPRGLARSGKNNFGNGFLPAAFQGTDFTAANPPNNLNRHSRFSASEDKRTVDLLARLNAAHLERYPDDKFAGRSQARTCWQNADVGADVMNLTAKPSRLCGLWC